MEEDAKNILDGEKVNEEVCLTIGVEKDETLQQMAIRRKVRVLWTYHEIKGIGKGNDDGMWMMWRRKKKRGRPRKKWMDEIHERTEMNLAELREATMERRQWRRYIMLIARAHRAESTR